MSKSEARTPGGSATKATGADNVQVVCRVRPLNTKEISECAHRCIQTVHDSIKLGDKIFTYNQVFAENSSQTDVFNSIGLPVIDGVFQGFNGTIFAYGQTGSGKTHTMMGPDFENNSTAELWGIIPRAVESIFSRISNAEDMECSVHVSFFEIYNEKVNDLLNSNNKGIDMRQANTEWEEVLTHKTVNGYQKAMKILEQGVANRKTASTDMNSTSSRSHSIFVISLKQTDVMTKRSLVGKLYLVDLAGSEKQKKTNTTGERFKEGTNINKSLFVLSRVISALTENQFVPYRDSVLTKVLKHSLGGNCKTALVINVSPASTNESETKSTLEFGSNAKKIKNDPRVNTLDDNKEMAELRGIIETQRLRIADLTKQLELIGGTDISLNASFTSISDFEGTGMNDSFSLSSVSSGVCHSCKVALEEEEKQLSSRGEELLAEVKSLRAKVKKGENTVLVYQKRLKDLEKMDAESKRIKDQQETHASWVKKQLDLTDEIKKLESEIPKITRQHTKTRSQHNELKDRLEKEEDQVEQLQNQIADLIDRSEQMKQAKEALMAELTISTTHAEVAIKEKQELQNQTKAMLATISSENDRLAEQLASLESELTKYNEKYQKTSELVNNQKMINDNMEKTLDELVSQRSKLSDRTTIIQRDLNTVTKDLKELEANKKNLIASREVARNNIGNVKQELADMKSLVQSVTNQVMDLKSQETKCVNELGMLEAKLISLTENKQRMGKEKEGLVKSIEDLTSELAEQSAKKKLLEQQSADLGRMEEELLAHNSHTKDRLESLKQLSAEYLRSLESTEIELNSRRSTIENLKQEMENHSEQKKFLECQYGILKIQSDSLQQKVSEAKSLKAQLEDDSNSISREISTLAEKCNLLELEKNELHHKGTELRSQLNQIHQENVSYHTEIEDVCRVLTESKVTLSVNKEVLAATKQELHIVKEELESKKAQLSNLHGHVASHSEQLQHMQHRNDTLRNNLEQLEEEHKNLANRLRVERETMAKEKQLHLQHMIDEENKRRETEKKYREEMLLASVQERKLQDESLDYEIQGYNTRLEKVVKEMQQEMSTKMQLLSVQSQEFEKRILAITRRKRELTMELQSQPHTSVDTIASPISKRRSVRVD